MPSKQAIDRMAKGVVHLIKTTCLTRADGFNEGIALDTIKTAFANLVAEEGGDTAGDTPETISPRPLNENETKAIAISAAALMSTRDTLDTLTSKRTSLDRYVQGYLSGIFEGVTQQINGAIDALQDVMKDA